MPRDLTNREEIQENARILHSLLQQELWWKVEENHRLYVDKRRSQIDEIQREIDNAHTRHDDAPDKVERLRRQLKRARSKVAELENRDKIEQLQNLIKREIELK